MNIKNKQKFRSKGKHALEKHKKMQLKGHCREIEKQEASRQIKITTVDSIKTTIKE